MKKGKFRISLESKSIILFVIYSNNGLIQFLHNMNNIIQIIFSNLHLILFESKCIILFIIYSNNSFIQFPHNMKNDMKVYFSFVS